MLLSNNINPKQVHQAIQQTGYVRSKRGYKQIRGIPFEDPQDHSNKAETGDVPNDPLYPKQWYIVSGMCGLNSCKLVGALG